MPLTKLVTIISIVIFIVSCGPNQPKKERLSKSEQAKIYKSLGIRYYKLGKLEEAKEKLNKAVQINPTDAQTYNALGVLYGRLNENLKARNYFEAAMNLDSKNAKIKNNYGRFLCEQSEYQKAMKYLKEAATDPTSQIQWQVLTNLGHCEILQGNKRKAVLNFKKTLLQNPNHAPALLEMSKIYYNDGNFFSARAFLERFFSASGKLRSSESLNLGYMIEKALDSNQQAEEYRTSLLREFPDSPEAEKLLLE